MSTLLSTEIFLSVIDSTPLVAIDLIVGDETRGYLLGQRSNKPAQHAWFVPGGRIRKGESLDDAFKRISFDELGLQEINRSDATLLGVYEHFYHDNFAAAPNISTHYVVLGYRLPIHIDLSASIPKEQHTAYRWAQAADILKDVDVHPNTQAYFK